MTLGRALLLGASIVALPSCEPGLEQGSGVDAGCPGPRVHCCAGGCNGDVVLDATCTPSGKWLCPDGYVSPSDCADAGTGWCGGAPMSG